MYTRDSILTGLQEYLCLHPEIQTVNTPVLKEFARQQGSPCIATVVQKFGSIKELNYCLERPCSSHRHSRVKYEENQERLLQMLKEYVAQHQIGSFSQDDLRTFCNLPNHPTIDTVLSF